MIEKYKKLQQLIEDSNKITLVSHIDPDGDTLGSSLAFYLALKKIGKKSVKLYNKTDSISNRYDFLPSFSKLTHQFPQNCDLVISFDCGSFKRLGIEKGDFKIINIDHHQSNELFGDLNIVEPSQPSTSAVVFNILKELDIEISKDIALSIYTALAEDTNFFTDTTTDTKAFELAMILTKKGADPSIVGDNLTRRNSLAFLRLEALFIDNMQLKKDGKIAIGFVDSSMLKRSGALRYDTAHLADILQSLATVKLSIFSLEDESGNVKFSLRSDCVDVSKIAAKYGGGGHKNSAGFSIVASKKEYVIEKIIKEVNI